ncbi:unnamed protein product [Owenia fusiformis]|uniref:18 kDa Sin3-associated polypeptide n=1 Tax=Owenia fusiformis TaxID=6347 RepID=A0A8J1TAB6_OWEFU|nr:unnamed protein product [Owenia fusiformis]
MASTVEVVDQEKVAQEKAIDREKACPLLLRVFCNMGRHNMIGEYGRGNTPSNELQIYTWMDASLKELTSLVKEVNHDAQMKGTFFDFALVYPESIRGLYRMRDIGTTCAGKRGADDNTTLAKCNFQIGDYVDISITPPQGGRGPPMDRMRSGMDRMQRGRPY